MRAPYFLATLYFLLHLTNASSLHGFKHAHKRHAALGARTPKPKLALTGRAAQVRCPTKVPGAIGLRQSSVALTSSQLSLTLKQAATASHSWEIGTYQTALLELMAPEMFLYNGSGSIPPILTNDSIVGDVFASVDSVVAGKPAGLLPLFPGEAIGDPASAGIALVIRNWTSTGGGALSKYATAANRQLTYLITEAPRAYNGAISQRAPPEEVQIWADFMSMAPPFICYYGAIQNNQSLIEEGYNQISAYYDILHDNGVGMMKHILLGDPGVQDHNHWATGNGWAVNGMLRVLRIIQLSNIASNLGTEQAILIQRVSTILSNVWNRQQPSGAVLNYITMNPSDTFEDASGTALLAACTFRLASLVFGTNNAPSVNVIAAAKARAWVISKIDADGWLNNVVDPYDWHRQGSHSPEGQSFVLMLQAAYRDWRQDTKGYY